MIHPIEQIDADQYKNRLIDNSILVGSIVGLTAFIIAVTTSDRSATNLNYYTDPLSFLILGSIYLLRNRVSISTKAAVMLIVIFTFVISDTLNWGFYSLNKVLIVLIPFFAVLIFRTRIALAIYLGVVLIYLVIGYLNHTNVIANSDQLLSRISSVPVWIESGLLLSCVSLIVIVFTRGYNKVLGAAVEDLKSKNLDLIEREKHLEERNERLAEYAFINSHVIRAPLARLLGLVEIVKEEATVNERKEFLEDIKSSASELDRIVRGINDILTNQEGFDREKLIALIKSQQ